MQHGESDYLFFWEPPGYEAPSEYIAGLQRWFAQVEGDDYNPGIQFGVDQQYYDLSGEGASKRFVPYAVQDAGMIIDKDSYPTSECHDEDEKSATAVCLTSEQIVDELQTYIAAHHLPTGIDVEYFVLTPESVGSCFDSTSGECSYSAYCGYHDYAGSGSSQILYADLPWLYDVSGCDVSGDFGVGHANSDEIDPVVSVFTHELSETMTDPNLDAWIQDSGPDSGYEIADKCAYIYGPGGEGSLEGLSSNGHCYWNVELEGNVYLMQLMFDNRTDNCALADSDTQPTVSIDVNPSTPAPQAAATFTAEVTDPAGVSSIEWSFGDGDSASGASVEHTYASAGPKELTVLVTDEHGNEKQLTKEIEVTNGGGGGGGEQSSEGGGGSAETHVQEPAGQPVSATTTNATSTVGRGGSAGHGAKAAGKPKPRCATVTKRIHGHKRKVKICAAAKPKIKSGKAHGKRG